jgi:hypothetical protein
MRLRIFIFVTLSAITTMVALAATPVRAQEPLQYESDLMAKRRLFRPAGPGLRQIRRGPNGNYYVLTAPAAAVSIFDQGGKRVGEVPTGSAAAVKGAALVFGDSFDVDRQGHLAVFDSGAKLVKLYGIDGALAATIPVSGPASVALLPGGEVAVTSPTSSQLVTVYDFAGRVARDFGDREEIADSADLNRQANLGHLATDENGDTYFGFDYLPEPTVRKFDPVGYLALEISLKTIEFEPAAQAARRAIARSEGETPALHRIITAIGVDPQTQDIWLAIGTLLMHFDKDGTRLASFRTYMPDGARIEASTILVEPDRLLIGADPFGVYEFPRPAKLPQ